MESYQQQELNLKGFDYTIQQQDAKAITIDLGRTRQIRSLHYKPTTTGMISHYEIWAGNTLDNMERIATGEFSNIRNNPIMQDVYFAPADCRYVQLKAVHLVNESESASYDKDNKKLIFVMETTDGEKTTEVSISELVEAIEEKNSEQDASLDTKADKTEVDSALETINTKNTEQDAAIEEKAVEEAVEYVEEIIEEQPKRRRAAVINEETEKEEEKVEEEEAPKKRVRKAVQKKK